MTFEEYQEKYDCLERDERELQACIDFARKEGRAEGLVEGRLEVFSQLAAALGVSVDEVWKMSPSIAKKAIDVLRDLYCKSSDNS